MSTHSPAVIDAAEAINRLAGRAGSRNLYRYYMTEVECGHVLKRVDQAKTAAGLRGKQFRALKGAALRTFARMHRLTAMEVRFAQALAEVNWAMRRARQLNGRVARQRTATTAAAGRLQ